MGSIFWIFFINPNEMNKNAELMINRNMTVVSGLKTSYAILTHTNENAQKIIANIKAITTLKSVRMIIILSGKVSFFQLLINAKYQASAVLGLILILITH